MAFEVPKKVGAGVIACRGKPYRVKIRRGPGIEVRPEAEQLDGRVYIFREGWTMEDGDPYPGEEALVPNDFDWPADAPVWIASGDLEEERLDMQMWAALVEWESGGIEEVPTKNLLELRDQLEQELERRLPNEALSRGNSLKAQWQADLMEQARRVRNYRNPHDVFEAIPVTALEGELRRQAEGS